MRAYLDCRPAAAGTLLLLLVAGCAQVSDPEPAEPVPRPWAWEMPDCVAYQPEAYAAPEHRVAVSVDSTGVITEEYEPGWGPRAVEEIWSVVRTCGSYEYGGLDDPEAYREQHTVVETGFAADESLLVESVRLRPPEPPRVSYTAVVRTGDVVVTVREPGLGATEAMCLAGASLATCGSAQT